MTAPLDRVQRLREETARVVAAPWTIDDDNQLALVSVRMPYDASARLPHAAGYPFRIPAPNDATAHHIARWDPAAAEKVLDLLAGLLLDHDGCTCAEYTAALAVLDALDGGDPT